jgi:hypothetical protein
MAIAMILFPFCNQNGIVADSRKYNIVHTSSLQYDRSIPLAHSIIWNVYVPVIKEHIYLITRKPNGLFMVRRIWGMDPDP